MSNHNKLLVSIRDYLSRFQTQVKIATANSEYDINQHSENILIPIFDIVFNGKFKNPNDSEKKNFESVDLIDDQVTNIGIQVTSTNSLDKVKSTLTKFTKYGLQHRIKEAYIYILTDKQRSYSADSIETVLKGKFKFDSSEHIWDVTDLYTAIKRLNNVQKFQKINELLELQFSDLNIGNDFDYSDYNQFRSSYKEKCLNNFSRLNFFGLSISKKPREVELYQLFVPPFFNNRGTFSRSDFHRKINVQFTFPDFNLKNIINKSVFDKFLSEQTLRSFKGMLGNEQDSLKSFSDESFTYLFSHHQHTVILGNPGAGKSSIIKYSICKILEADETVFENNDIYRYLPFRIELHKYNQAKVGQGCNIVQYLVKSLATEYQTNISLERLIKILSFIPCLIFFDGIDEIFDVQERIDVRNDIENFASNYPDTKIIITSRFESYEEVSFKNFYTLEVKNFEQSQLEDYVHKWYNQEEGDPERRKTEIAGCIAQLGYVNDELKYNPLLLSLILILYRNELELPTNKLNIYEGCTNTIVEHRDEKEKKLKFNLQILNKASVFSAIAFWQFDNSNKKVDSSFVQSFVKKYLIKNEEIEDEYQAHKAAAEFLEFAKVRSIYFENKFTHKTFLEYFTAYYIFTKYYIGHNQRQFNALLDKNIGLSSWAVVLELLICKIDANISGPKMLSVIIDRQIEKNKNDALLFFLQVIKYLTNINDKIVCNLVSLSLQSCFTETFPLKESKINHQKVLFEHLVNIYSVPRFQSAFLKSFELLIKDNMVSLNQIATFAYEFSIPAASTELIDLFNSYTQYEETADLFSLKIFRNIVSEDNYVEVLKSFTDKFGVEASKQVYRSVYDQPLFFGEPYFNWLISFIITVPPTETYNRYNKLRKIGISQTAIRQAIDHRMLPYSIVESYEKMLKGLPKSGFRDFLQTIVRPLRKKKERNDEKFYDVFYQKQR